MKLKIWQNLLLSIFLASTNPGWYCKAVGAVETANSDTHPGSQKIVSKISSTASSPLTNEVFRDPFTNPQPQTDTYNPDISFPPQKRVNLRVEIAQNDSLPTPPNLERNDPPPLETNERQPTDFRGTSPVEIEQKLNPPPKDRAQRIKGLLRRLKKNEDTEDDGADFSFPDAGNQNELGDLIVQQAPLPPELTQPPATEQTASTFKPVGYLLGRLGYFHTSNVFSSAVDPVDDGLIYSGLTLGTTPIQLGSKTYLNGSIEGNLIRYIEQSQFDYNQVIFNLSIYRQLTPKMFGEIGWNNQQLFYARDSDRRTIASGDRFFNENAFHLALGRRDPLAPKLTLDSFYQLRYSLTTTPEQRNRLNNFLWISLNYDLLKSLKAGINYQFSLSDFTERTRQDQYHRLYANLNYSISDLSNISLQAGATLGGSTDSDLDFDGWFFTVNYSWDLGQF